MLKLVQDEVIAPGKYRHFYLCAGFVQRARHLLNLTHGCQGILGAMDRADRRSDNVPSSAPEAIGDSAESAMAAVMRS